MGVGHWFYKLAKKFLGSADGHLSHWNWEPLKINAQPPTPNLDAQPCRIKCRGMYRTTKSFSN
jgi:hypothetical protein